MPSSSSRSGGRSDDLTDTAPAAVPAHPADTDMHVGPRSVLPARPRLLQHSEAHGNAVVERGATLVAEAATVDDVLAVMAAQERTWAQQIGSGNYPFASVIAPDVVLRACCWTSSHRWWFRLFPDDVLPPAAPDFSTVTLPVRSLMPLAAVDVLGGEVLHAFAASCAAYAGFKISPGWLRDQFGAGAGYTAAACVNGGGGVSTTLLQHGSALFVATAGVLSWRAWVNFFCRPDQACGCKHLPLWPT
eukprot:TRINITY_DN3509_c0_g1_i5.p2 TRINITY_DN3509_c0_g1~~TRINITY_DN3509_c0_g1_i5.p2  ORF type:complete len:246 (-),score=28.47 TRINITY_DN3509_c0_g1_i5:937-1674(-)